MGNENFVNNFDAMCQFLVPIMYIPQQLRYLKKKYIL